MDVIKWDGMQEDLGDFYVNTPCLPANKLISITAKFIYNELLSLDSEIVRHSEKEFIVRSDKKPDWQKFAMLLNLLTSLYDKILEWEHEFDFKKMYIIIISYFQMVSVWYNETAFTIENYSEDFSEIIDSLMILRKNEVKKLSIRLRIANLEEKPDFSVPDDFVGFLKIFVQNHLGI